MKKLIAVGCVTLSLFVSSAGLSWYLRQQRAAAPHAAGNQGRTANTPLERALEQPVAKSDEPALPRTAVRPPYSAGADEAVQLATSLRDRLVAVREKESQLTERQKNLELIYEDIAGERNAIAQLREQLDEEAKLVEERMEAVQKRLAESDRQGSEISSRVTQMKKEITELEGFEQANIKKMAEMYDSMEPESAARILEQLANSAKMDTAVKLLGQMKERQAAKVLAALPPESGLAAQLLEKLKGFKKPSSLAQK